MSSPAPETQRLFFALWPDAGLQAAIHAHVRPLIAGSGRSVAPENLHLTLAFLGSVTAATRACYEQAASLVSGEAFELYLTRLGHWPKPRVLWYGPQATPAALQALVRTLQAGLVNCGFTPETRPYQAHMTVARKVGGRWQARDIDPVAWRVDRFVLAESVTDPSGAYYRVLRSWPLGEAVGEAGSGNGS